MISEVGLKSSCFLRPLTEIGRLRILHVLRYGPASTVYEALRQSAGFVRRITAYGCAWHGHLSECEQFVQGLSGLL